jgi:hypothetical protein
MTFKSIPEIIAHIDGKFVEMIWVGRDYSIRDLITDLQQIENDHKVAMKKMMPDDEIHAPEYGPNKSGKYELWVTQGQGGDVGGLFDSLGEALAFVKEHEGEASFGIKYPNGDWHNWHGD